MGLSDLTPFGDELVLLVIGPGFGESVLVRWPPNDWLVVDSCHRVAGAVERHPAIEALVEFDAHPVAVALTHPHLDHTGGFASLIARRREHALVGWLAEPESGVWWATPSGVRAARDGDTEHALAAIERVWADEPAARWELFENDQPLELGEMSVEVLSPAIGAVDAVKAMAEPDFNRASSAMLLRWRQCTLVLGADLTRPGWEDVQTSHADLSLSDAQGLKASHHASWNAQHPVALGLPPARARTVVATPYNKGRKVPNYGPGGDVEHILELTEALLVTGHHGPLPAGSHQDLACSAVTVPIRSIGRLQMELDSPPPAVDECWVAARFAPDGSLIGITRGAGSMRVTA
jgi:Metallo-beta-lactamase superfamily